MGEYDERIPSVDDLNGASRAIVRAEAVQSGLTGVRRASLEMRSSQSLTSQDETEHRPSPAGVCLVGTTATIIFRCLSMD